MSDLLLAHYNGVTQVRESIVSFFYVSQHRYLFSNWNAYIGYLSATFVFVKLPLLNHVLFNHQFANFLMFYSFFFRLSDPRFVREGGLMYVGDVQLFWISGSL